MRGLIAMNEKVENYKRTSIDIIDLQNLKKYCLEKNISLKSFVNEAIKEKLKRERKQTHLVS
jgi:hypothetical protein